MIMHLDEKASHLVRIMLNTNICSLSHGTPGERVGVRGLNCQTTSPLTPNASPRVQGEVSKDTRSHAGVNTLVFSINYVFYKIEVFL